MSWGTAENNNTYDKDAPYIIYNDGAVYPENFDPTQENFPCVPGSLQMKPKGAWMEANLNKAVEAGGDKVQILHETPGIKLLRGKDGRVNGVGAQRKDGEYIKVNAAKGIVLATGGFLNNEAMMKKFLPEVLQTGYVVGSGFYGVREAEGNPCNVGDGHKMGCWVGTKIQQYAACMSHLVAVHDTIGTMPLLWLNKRDQRFINEDTQGQQFAERVRMLPDQCAYQLIDGRYEDYRLTMPLGHGKYPERTLSVVDENVDGESVFKADTLDKLLDQLDIDKETAKESIDRYNQLCAAGADEDFGKNAKYLHPLSEGPFYAIKYGRGDDLVTISGLESDRDCHILDENLEVIPGLYVAGNVQGGRFAEIYPETCGNGHDHGPCGGPERRPGHLKTYLFRPILFWPVACAFNRLPAFFAGNGPNSGAFSACSKTKRLPNIHKKNPVESSFHGSKYGERCAIINNISRLRFCSRNLSCENIGCIQTPERKVSGAKIAASDSVIEQGENYEEAQ